MTTYETLRLKVPLSALRSAHAPAHTDSGVET
jgi:hypothetical protein